MNIFSLLRLVGSLPGVKRQALPTFLLQAALLGEVNRRRRRRRPRHPRR